MLRFFSSRETTSIMCPKTEKGLGEIVEMREPEVCNDRDDEEKCSGHKYKEISYLVLGLR